MLRQQAPLGIQEGRGIIDRDCIKTMAVESFGTAVTLRGGLPIWNCNRIGHPPLCSKHRRLAISTVNQKLDDEKNTEEAEKMTSFSLIKFYGKHSTPLTSLQSSLRDVCISCKSNGIFHHEYSNEHSIGNG